VASLPAGSLERTRYTYVVFETRPLSKMLCEVRYCVPVTVVLGGGLRAYKTWLVAGSSVSQAMTVSVSKGAWVTLDMLGAVVSGVGVGLGDGVNVGVGEDGVPPPLKGVSVE